MNEPTRQNTPPSPAKNVDPSKKSESTNGAPPQQQQSGQSGRPADPKETAQSAAPQVTPKVQGRDADTQSPSKPSITTPPYAGKGKTDGNTDTMSRQQGQSMPSVDEVKGTWKKQVGAAKIAWGKLTDDELLESEGHAQKLAGLIQERYAVTRDEAEKQVKSFIEKNKLN